jgi:G3E family GTPase
MRVLCLHPAASSALQFSQDLHKLEERLWNKHGIELVFIDGPLLDVQLGNAVGDEGGGIHALEPSRSATKKKNGAVSDANDNEHVSRRWYVAEPFTRSALPSEQQPTMPSSVETAATITTKMRYSGLDASLLHLSQIWSRGGANISNNLGECMPFQGVLGCGQGADVAALLPLLHRHEDDVDDSDEEGDNNNSASMNNKAKALAMFEGLQFVILIDGKDILLQNMNDDENDDGNVIGDDEDVYVGPNGIHSLHVIMEGNDHRDRERRSSSERLAKQYGPNATIHNCKLQSTDNSMMFDTSNMASWSALFNSIGKFLVTQKNALHCNSQTRELMMLQNQLLNVEQLATIAISEEIQRNPPNALMAVIGPSAMMSTTSSANDDGTTNDKVDDEVVKLVDKAVGAWQGGRRREFGEEGGGAPCPQEFLLREEERSDAILPAVLHDGKGDYDDDSEDEIPILQILDDEDAIPALTNIEYEKEIRNSHLPPVPVTILTGFLGSGKSTLVRHILTSSTHQKRIAVIDNEFGGGDDNITAVQQGMAINNDASTLSVETMIVKDGTDGSNLTDYIELPNGCVCCTVKDSLVETLEALLTKRSDLDYIIIEASGLADPGPVASIFWLDEALNSRLRLDGIVTCVDAKNIAFQLESTSSAPSSCNSTTDEDGPNGGGDEAARQIAFADRIVVNKIDLLQSHQAHGENEIDIYSVIRQIQGINPTAPIKTTTFSMIENLDWILDANCFDAERAKDVECAFQYVTNDNALEGTIPYGESSAGKVLNSYNCNSGCCSGNHPPNDVCGLCSTEKDLSPPTVDLHRHTNAVGTIALFGFGSVDLHRVHSWLASILWPNQDESDKILRARLESNLSAKDETNTEDAVKSKSQVIYRVKGILSVGHAMDEAGAIIPASNDWVDEGIVTGVIDTINGTDNRRFILQAVHDLWDINPASENIMWKTNETRCCKVIVIGKYLEIGELQNGFNACFSH